MAPTTTPSPRERRLGSGIHSSDFPPRQNADTAIDLRDRGLHRPPNALPAERLRAHRNLVVAIGQWIAVRLRRVIRYPGDDVLTRRLAPHDLRKWHKQHQSPPRVVGPS